MRKNVHDSNLASPAAAEELFRLGARYLALHSAVTQSVAVTDSSSAVTIAVAAAGTVTHASGAAVTADAVANTSDDGLAVTDVTAARLCCQSALDLVAQLFEVNAHTLM